MSFGYCTVQVGDITDISEELSAFTSRLNHKTNRQFYTLLLAVVLVI